MWQFRVRSVGSKDAPGAIVDVIVASNRLLQSQPEKISELLAAYYSRIDAHVLDGSQLKNQIAEDGKLSPSSAAAVLQGIEFFTAVEAKNWLTDGTLEKRIGSTAAVLTLAGRLNQVSQKPNDLSGQTHLVNKSSLFSINPRKIALTVTYW